MKNEFCLILSTAPDQGTARSIARALVDKQLVACVNILPAVESIYRWQGRVESASELLLLMKTTAATSREAIAELSRLHPYEVPEAIVLPITAGLTSYLSWIGAECDSLG
jgi:periplasmic divalent cation tolerance protein